ncbi:nephrin-like [Palaemon carinicauda]|uniref:nephrin-like n=1 Tax=Palaemon carinicauda TaxID=392227 RepID=UPI0035B5F35D
MFVAQGELLILIFITLLRQTVPVAAHKGIWRRVEAVSGREAVLPCEVGTSEASDMVYVVLWYRNGDKEPIYSFDNRPGRLQASEDRHTIKSDVLQGRVNFRPGLLPALHIKPVMTHDQANYTCRVDFRIASSRRTHLSLQVVVPPEEPVLRVGGQRVTDSVLGPLQEESPLAITCSVAGGVPPPSLIWMRHKQILDDLVESRSAALTVNQLSIGRLTRTFHNARLTCLAANNNVTTPVQASITVTMNLRPVVTKLEAHPKGLRVGRDYEITCTTAGSRPHPNITWTLGNIASVTPLPAHTEHGVNKSTSTVRITAARRHHGQRLTCTALNPLYPAYPLSDSILLNVTYPPIATIELGRGVTSVVKEGEDVYFNCNVDSNPPTYKISWYHKGVPIYHGPDKVVLLIGNNLALRAVTRHQAGPYVCSASNVEGDAHSSPLNLSVNYAPVCRDEDESHGTVESSAGPSKVYATGLGQYINVSCEVKASPTDVRYSWVFNNSVTSERLPGDQVFTTADGRSIVRFLARAHKDYGTLQCWAENAVGRMTTPCLFHVVPAGRPERPVGCAVVNKTYDSLAVGCTAGFDGGVEQTFLAKVFEAVTGRSQVNVSARWPNFTLEGLTPGLDYVIQVMARNSLGESPPVKLEAFTYKMAENRMRDEQVEEELRSSGAVAGALLASIIVVVVLLVVLALIARCIWTRRRLGGLGESNRRKGRGYAPPDKPGNISDDEDIQFEVPTISLEAHRDPITHIADQAL